MQREKSAFKKGIRHGSMGPEIDRNGEDSKMSASHIGPEGEDQGLSTVGQSWRDWFLYL